MRRVRRQRVPDITEDTMTSATLKLPRGWIGVQRHPFEITLDGTVVGTVPRQETVELRSKLGITPCASVRAGRSAQSAPSRRQTDR